MIIYSRGKKDVEKRVKIIAQSGSTITQFYPHKKMKTRCGLNQNTMGMMRENGTKVVISLLTLP